MQISGGDSAPYADLWWRFCSIHKSVIGDFAPYTDLWWGFRSISRSLVVIPLHMQITDGDSSFTHVIQIYSPNMYYMYRTTGIMQVYVLPMYYMSRNTGVIHV